jgi:hypothetical protein
MSRNVNVMTSTMRNGVKVIDRENVRGVTILPTSFDPAQTTVGEVMEYFSRTLPASLIVPQDRLSLDDNGYYIPYKYLSFSEICPWMPGLPARNGAKVDRWRGKMDLFGEEIVGKYFDLEEMDDDTEAECFTNRLEDIDSDLTGVFRDVVNMFPHICFKWSYITKENIIGEHPINIDIPWNLFPPNRDELSLPRDYRILLYTLKRRTRMTLWVDVVQIEEDYQQMHGANRVALTGRWASNIDLESQRDGRKDSLSSYLRDDNAIGLMSKVRSHRGVPKVWGNEEAWREENIGYHPIPTLGERIYERDAPEDKFLTRTWSIGGRKKYRKKRSKSKRSKSKRSKSKRSKSKRSKSKKI